MGQPITATGMKTFNMKPTYEQKVIEYGTQAFTDGTSTGTVTTQPLLTVDQTDSQFDEMVTTLNYNAASIWYKLDSAPSYLKAQQALALISNKMGLTFRNFYFGFYAYQKYFNNEAETKVNVISILTTDAA